MQERLEYLRCVPSGALSPAHVVLLLGWCLWGAPALGTGASGSVGVFVR